ncbi:hypothetical protein OG871_01500 [Kitasatospora sp. NBC_00374]|uniref:hypothetical protein n=1 Tax=Kitasatospora sp. NBC_00374 TaxID=2975964 RepID=UPI0032469D83
MEIGQRWRGCESHLEPGSQAALSAALPVAFVLELAAAYLGGWIGGWIARNAEAEAGTFAEVVSAALAVFAVAVVLIALAGTGGSSCPTPP